MFLLGAADGVAEKVRQKVNSLSGYEMVTGVYSPPFGFENNDEECQKIVDLINESKADVIVVGLGAPKQEKWIHKHMRSLPGIRIFMAVGATLDFEAGVVERSPQWMSEHGLEWLFRLYKEPSRLWKLYLVDDMLFFYYLLKQKLGLYN